jgi:hypothetical protein
MATFRDNKEREWTIRLDGPSILRVREESDERFLLNDDVEPNTATRLAADPALLCHVIFLLCQKQREERSVSLDEFYEEVIGCGDTLAAAGDALEAALANFSHPRKRVFITAIAEKQRAVENLAMEQALAKIQDPALEEKIKLAIDAQIDAALNRLIQRPNVTDLLDLSE